MSVYYEIREHLVTDNGTGLYMLGRRVALLAARTLMGEELGLSGLYVKAGDKECSVTGSEITAELRETLALIMEAAGNMAPAEVILEYATRWSSGDEELCSMTLPSGLCEELDHLPEEQFGNTKYTMWNDADCSDGMGVVTFYGRGSDGVFHRGDDGLHKEVTELPEGEAWLNNVFVWMQDGEMTEEQYNACYRLSLAAGTKDPERGETFEDGFTNRPDLLREEDGTVSYALVQAYLEGAAAVDSFAQCFADVLRAAGEEEPQQVEFVSMDDAEPRMLRLTVSADGTVKKEVTAF